MSSLRSAVAARIATAACVLCAACGGGAGEAKAPTVPPGPPLHLAPSTDLAQAAGLVWLVDVLPKAILAHPELRPAIDLALPPEKLAALGAKNGGVDLLALDELVVATYAADEHATTLYVARGAVEPTQLEAAFKARAESIDGRALERGGPEGILRTWGTVDGARQQLAVLGHDGALLEIGHFGPLRVAQLFAAARLKRASPALREEHLARAAQLLRDLRGNDAPARGFALGPFDGPSGKALGGLVAASTAVAIAARPAKVDEKPAVAFTLVLLGAWGEQAREAATRLHAAFDAASATPLGRLTGVDRPLVPVVAEGLSDALRLTLTVDALALARGVNAANGAEVREIMSY